MNPMAEYNNLDLAYRHFNAALFGDTLPPCLITLRNHGKSSRGYFLAKSFAARGEEHAVDEIALCSGTFEGRTDKEILSTLVHEMAHCWQQHKGTPPRRCYHDQEWARKMQSIGLFPSDTGAPGGKMTGQRCSHYIVEGGPFDKAADALLAKGYKIAWQEPKRVGGSKSKQTRVKWVCPGCGMAAWAKASALLVCGGCGEGLQAQE